MPRTVFVDTSYLVALLDPRDRLNAAAVALSQRLVGGSASLCTTDAVLIEFANYFARSPLRAHCIRWIHALRGGQGLTVLPILPRFLLDAESRYRRHADKNWSLTDCHSMEVMKARAIREIASSDDGFRQAGFRILL